MKDLYLLLGLILVTAAIDSLVNPNATARTKALHQKFIDNYGFGVFSGQTTFNYDDFVSRVNKRPIVRGFDMQNYSPNNPWYRFQPHDDGTVDAAIKWYADTCNQGIVTFFWHWFSPIQGWQRTSTFYTSNTGFDVSKAVISGTPQYTATIRDIDAIAVQLKKLQAKDIPVLWRPLHQAGGGWFWWGAKGSAAAKALYNILYDRLTNHHRINNLIWSWSTPQPDWYPGNNIVDTIGFDSYPGSQNYICQDNIFNQLNQIVGGKRIIQETQNGPIPDIQVCLRGGIKWGLFMTWNQLTFSHNSIEHIKKIYDSPKVNKLRSTTQQTKRLKNLSQNN